MVMLDVFIVIYVLVCAGKNLDRYKTLAHPYIQKYGIGDTFTWVLAMSPLMSEVLNRSDCIEVDITYKSCIELPYLFNVAAFNDVTMRCKCLIHHVHDNMCVY